ncbi:hypothetical protein N1851_015950 [Merluccius polli]|uniref:L-ornithine N(5)-monooxygenase n=1 Tax=Merluccius polli TaxID=89951 RepID=A0AA47MRX4_MERPO|nr:hypothetical protein N1851_015950 [Merluccius polli]
MLSVGETASGVEMLDVLIIGGGPHALTLASLLSTPDPHPADGSAPTQQDLPGLDPKLHRTRTQNHSRARRDKRRAKQRVEERTVPLGAPDRGATPALDLRVVDSYGEWACLWESQFSALNIPHLRSHTLVHTDPFNKEWPLLTLPCLRTLDAPSVWTCSAARFPHLVDTTSVEPV